MNTPPPFFVIDVESVGLHGEAFAVAGGVYLTDGSAQWEFRFACPIDECAGDADDRQWVKDNVPGMELTHRTPKAMRGAFWDTWQNAKRDGATMAAECLWPVEAGFVARCINDDLATRKWEGPYPFLDISSVLTAAGMDPMAKYDRTASEEPAHDPLADARQSARLLSEALIRINGAADPENAPLAATVDRGRLMIAIGIETLAWASRPENGGTLTGCSVDPKQYELFARDVAREIMKDINDDAIPISEFLDRMITAAADSGSGSLLIPKRKTRRDHAAAAAASGLPNS